MFLAKRKKDRAILARFFVTIRFTTFGFRHASVPSVKSRDAIPAVQVPQQPGGMVEQLIQLDDFTTFKSVRRRRVLRHAKNNVFFRSPSRQRTLDEGAEGRKTGMIRGKNHVSEFNLDLTAFGTSADAAL
jgi:hypothetical protein